MIYYRKGAKNRDGEIEAPHIIAGSEYQISEQVRRWGESAREKHYFTLFCSNCGYGLCKHIEIGTVQRWVAGSVMLVEACPHCLKRVREGGPDQLEVVKLPMDYRNAMLERDWTEEERYDPR